MAVRNCAEIGENLQKIADRLLHNEDLMKLLYYTDKDPINQLNLTEEEKMAQLHKLVKIIPRIGSVETANSFITILVSGGTSNENDEFEDLLIEIETFVPVTQWVIKDTNLRPFKIMGEIQKSLVGKKINGLGKISGGDFSYNFGSEEITCYKQLFIITVYD